MAPLRGKFLFLYIITLISVTKIHSNSPVSGSCSCSYGSYPGPFCHATNVILNHTSRTFIIPTADPLPSGTGATFTVWPVSTQEVPRPPLCDRTLKEALFFTFFYWYGHSNYFHLHYDTLIPVYKYVRDRRGKAGETHRLTLMPTVETSRLKVMNWDTDAFHEKNLNKYFVLVHKTLAGDEFDLVPADSHLFASNPNGFTCFETAHFGVPSVGYPNPEIVPEFTNFIRQRLGLTSLPPPNIPRVGLITRATRRRITNEDELIAAISPIVEAERIEFSGMTFKEQVKAVQRFTVLVGMNGAGLMNAIYLPEGAVAIQLAPYNATQLNVNEFGKVLKSRGPYMEWRNTHAEKSSSTREADPFNSQADSEVDVAEFIELIQEALRTGINRKLKQDL